MTRQRAHNPYIAGKALSQQRGFWGREDILHLVETELRSPDRNAVVLHGQRRIGKTSILLQLQRRLSSPSLLPVYFDLMDRAHRPLEDVLYELACAVASEAGMAPISRQSFDDPGDYFRRDFLPALYQTLGAERRPLLLLDEFDVLDVAAEKRLSRNAASHAFFPYLRRLMEGEPRLGFVFVIGRKTEELSTDIKATFKAARNQRVSILDEKNAIELITTAHRQGSLLISDAAVERILMLTAGHPYFTQLFCQILWDHAYATRPEDVPGIDENTVDAVMPRVLEAGENVFEWIWDGLPAAERVIFAAIAAATDEHRVTKETLIDILQHHGIRILTGELEVAPEKLVKWEMLRETDEGYRFFIELMRRWIKARKPLTKVRDDLDRVEPLADTLYQAGVGFHQQGDLDRAQDQLSHALRLNPNHLKARLLLAKLLFDQRKIHDAVRELELAYSYDPDATRYRLIQALLGQAEEHERRAEKQSAIAAYQRALQISPSERVAQERLLAVWRHIGDEHFQKGELEAAARAYEHAGQPEQVSTILGIKKQRELEARAAEAHRFEILENWGKAAEAYQWLASQQPENFSWQAARDRVSAELVLSRQYSEGIDALNAAEWSRALRSLAYVVQHRPDYKDATDRLAQAIQQQQLNNPNAPRGFLKRIEEQKQQLATYEASLEEKANRLARVENALSARQAEVEQKAQAENKRELQLQQREEQLRFGTAQWVQVQDGGNVTVWLSFSEAALGAVRTFFVAWPDGSVQCKAIRFPPRRQDGDVFHFATDESGSELASHDKWQLELTVRVVPHPWFRSQGDDLEFGLPLTAVEAGLGTVVVRVPPGTGVGQKLRLRGKGLPKIREDKAGSRLVDPWESSAAEARGTTEDKDAKGARGDLYVVVNILTGN
jgi:Tfp pilus assembly protein PilF